MSAIKLENLLEKAVKDPAVRPEFYTELMRSDLIVLYHPDDNSELKSGLAYLKKDTPVRIKEFQSRDRGVIIPVFTSIEALQKGIKTEEAYLQLNAKKLFEITKGNGASYILNPYSDYSKEFLPDEINNLLDDTIPQSNVHVIDKDTKILVGQPREYPRNLVNALRKYFSKTNIVQSAYLAQIFISNKDISPHLMVGICMQKNNEVVLRNAIVVSQPFLKKEDVIDFMIVKENDQLVNGVEPFFKNTFINKIKNTIIGLFA